MMSLVSSASATPTASLRTHLNDIAQMIEQQKQLLAQMESYETQIRHELDRVAFYPVLSLPAEIVTEIFIHCLPDPEHINANVNEAPLLLMAVCKQWARIALSVPALWRSLELDGREWEDQELLDVMELWFRGNATRKAALRGEIFPTVLARFMQSFGAKANRITELTLAFGEETLLEFKEIPFQMSQLTELAVYGFASAGQSLAINAPLLRRASFFSISPASLSIQWSQLTDVTCGNYSFDHFFEALNLLPNLIRFDVTMASDGEHRDQTRGTLTHLNLRHLRLVQDSDSRPQLPMLHFLALPHLESLETDEADEVFLGAFLIRSAGPHLETLRFLANSTTSSKLLITILRTLNGLVSFDMRYPSTKLVSKFFRRFSADTKMLPNLRSLQVGCRDKSGEISLVGLTSILGPAVIERNKRAKQKATQRIDTLRLVVSAAAWSTYTIPKSDLQPYQELKDDGVDVYLGTKDHPFEWDVSG
ncbi:F-box domain-containing protein [Mycena indigotica]|uniref:F-box domain-containing protein n=1 Tax=Mycena indigotica TaxID=2126181 RepID=A0A8H6W471_9AGAR|nr:F-box domain-containing protein [Mycena indigotica]KAF7302251.1 F-box domain-containing protein [Mycena indigotica]